jgi:divalent metal cation (Fe/Co/Zn/Cd) transporter
MQIQPFCRPDVDRLYGQALVLARLTVGYNIVEGLVSVGFGIDDETLALFGFGIDSFVEVVSGIGVWHMIHRVKADAAGNRDRFERRALRITGIAFLILALGLIVGAVLGLVQGHKPETTFWGMVVGSVSIATMALLIHYKSRIGRLLNSPALLADAACTRTCLYLSLVLLISSAGFRLTGIGGLDAVGAMAIAVFSFHEGTEALEKAAGKTCGCEGGCASASKML